MTGLLAKRAVDYRLGTPAERCGNCVMFRHGWSLVARLTRSGTCSIVKPPINAAMVCDEWEGSKP